MGNDKLKGSSTLKLWEKQSRFCCAAPLRLSSIATVDVGFLLDAWKMTLLTTSTFWNTFWELVTKLQELTHFAVPSHHTIVSEEPQVKGRNTKVSEYRQQVVCIYMAGAGGGAVLGAGDKTVQVPVKQALDWADHTAYSSHMCYPWGKKSEAGG